MFVSPISLEEQLHICWSSQLSEWRSAWNNCLRRRPPSESENNGRMWRAHVTLAFLCRVCAGTVYKVCTSHLKIRITQPLCKSVCWVYAGGIWEFSQGMTLHFPPGVELMWHDVKSLPKFFWVGLQLVISSLLTLINLWVSKSTMHDGISCYVSDLWDPLRELFSEYWWSLIIQTPLQNGRVLFLCIGDDSECSQSWSLIVLNGHSTVDLSLLRS